MKQTIAKALVTVLVLTAAFTACEKEGVYQSKKKISRVISKEEVIYSEGTFPPGEYVESENWIWEDNQLKYIQNSDYLLEFFYDGKRLSKVKMDEDLVFFYYKNTDLDYIEIMSYGSLYKISVEERKNGKITKLEFVEEDDFKNGGVKDEIAFNRIASLLKVFISDHIVDVLTKEQTKKSALAVDQKGTILTEITLEYEGDNVSQFKIYYPDDYYEPYTVNYVFTYDDKKNPYYHAFQLLPTSSGIVFGLLFSKNNVLSCYDTSEPENVINYKYTYEDDFPETKFYTETYDNGYYSITYANTITFEYID